MDRSLLDTDILSEVLKNRDQTVAPQARTYMAEHARLTVSAVTVMEVVKGFQQVQREDRLELFLSVISTLEILPFDSTAAVLARRIYGDLHRTGQPIGRADPMVAATAVMSGLVIVTGNTGHYDRIARLGFPLMIANWRHGAGVTP